MQKTKIIISIILLITTILLSSCATVVISTNTEETKTAEKPDPTATKTIEEEKTTILQETVDVGNDYLNKIVFLGDSTTYHIMKLGPFADGNHNVNVLSGEYNTITLEYVNLDETKVKCYTTNDHYELLTVKDAIELKKPEILVITLGINGCKYLSEAYFKAIYCQLIENIQAVSPNTKIVVDSIFPVTEMCSDGSIEEYFNNLYGYNPDGTPKKTVGNDYSIIPIEKIKTANKWLLDIAKQYDLYYLNSYEALANNMGFLPDDYCVGDGEHLTATAYEVLFKYIKTHSLPEYVK